MTIKDLSTVITCHKYIEKSKFRGLRVAIDFLIYWYIAHSKACYEEVGSLPLLLIREKKYDTERILDMSTNYFLKFLCDILKEGILPVVVFDGQAFDLKSKHAAIKRQKVRDRAKERLEEMKEKKFEKFSEADIKTYKSIVCQNINFDRAEVFKRVKMILSHVGIPYLQCVTEAEHLAVALCKEGYCYAAYTSDSDTVALQCPFTICREGNREEPDAPFFKTLQYSDVQKELELTPSELTDVCVLTSCDYNERVSMISSSGKQKSIGIKTALQLIKEHHSIEKIIEAETIVEPERLETEACRQIFKSFSVKELCPSFTPEQLKAPSSCNICSPNPIDDSPKLPADLTTDPTTDPSKDLKFQVSEKISNRIEIMSMLIENLPKNFYFYSFWS